VSSGQSEAKVQQASPPTATAPAQERSAPAAELEKQVRKDAASSPSALDQVGSVAPMAPTAPAPSATAAAGAARQAQENAAPVNAAAPDRFALRRELASATDIVSPDPMVRWRVAGNTVERTINGGVSWETTRTGVTTQLTAGYAPSPTVVWVVGRSGVVLLATDGRTWRRLGFPEITDLSAIRAKDDRTASVTTGDGRVFSTTDAGITWVPGPLQGF
jgi:hypothetical protein